MPAWCWRPRTLLFCCFAIFNLRWLLLFLQPPPYHRYHKMGTESGGHTSFKGTVWKYVISAYMPFIRHSHKVTLSCKGGWAAICPTRTSIIAEENRYQGFKEHLHHSQQQERTYFWNAYFFSNSLLCEEKFSIEISKLLELLKRVNLS